MPINFGTKNCYGGPGKTDYAQVGTLDNGDSYSVLWNEHGFSHIEYTVTLSGQKKRGFIEGESSGTYQAGYPSGVLGTMKSAQTVLSGPGLQYASVGSVSAAENVSIFQETNNGYCYIEYSSPSKTKRGYVQIGTVTRNNSTALAKMLVNSTTYTEASTGSTVSGSVDKEEYVIVLQKNSTYAFAEYNTVSGRKRAYLLMANLAIQNTGAGVPALSGTSGLPASSSVSLSNLNPVTYTNGSTNEITYQTVADANQNTNSIGYLDPYESAKCYGIINGKYLLTYASGTTRKAGLVNWPDSVSGAATTGALYKNGSTSEPVYRTTADARNRTNSIGSLDSWEQAACFGTEEGFYLVAYLVTGTTNMKIGFVVYNGGLSGSSSGGIPASSSVSLSSLNPVTYTNGSTNELTYQTVADANQNTNSIGYLDPYESAKCFGIINGKYLLTYASGTTRKAGFVNWPDSVSGAATTGALYKNGSTSEPVYKTTADARNKVNSIGSLDAWEQAACFGTEDGFYLVAYLINGTTNIKTGFVAYNGGLYSAPVALPVIDQQSIPNATKGSYGTSGQNNDLVYYKVGNGPNHMIVNFAIHGFEDKPWFADGLALVHVARELLKSLSGSMYSLVNSRGWTVYVIPTSNPDGILHGTTNNGKGRCTTTWLDKGVLSTAHGIDMNRCFPAGFQSFYTDRNYTGPVSLGCREAVALRQFIDNQKSANGHNVFIDAHGWEQQIITGPYSSSRPGRAIIQNAFKSEFSGNSQNQGLYNGSGYVARYADTQGYDGCLYEFPNYSDVNSPEDIVNKGYAARFVAAIRKTMEGYPSAPNVPDGNTLEVVLKKPQEVITPDEYRMLAMSYLEMSDQEIENALNIILKARLETEIRKSNINVEFDYNDAEKFKKIQKYVDELLWDGGSAEAYSKLSLLNTILKKQIKVEFTTSLWLKTNNEKIVLVERQSNGSFGIKPGREIFISEGESKELKQARFAVNHPIIALAIGVATTGQGDTNISTNSSRFAHSFNLSNDNGLGITGHENEGTQVNAIRHLIWQATIANRYGAEIALEAGYAHEDHEHALERTGDPYKHHFDSIDDVDEAIDLLNNVIGREIGSSAGNMSMKVITQKALDYANKHGFNTVGARNGKYVITFQKISDVVFQNALQILDTLDANGFPPGDPNYNKQ